MGCAISRAGPLANWSNDWHIMHTMSTTNQNNFPDNPTFDFVMSRLKSILLDQIQEAIAEGVLHVPEYHRWRGELIDYALAPNLVRHVAKRFLIDRGQAAEGEEVTDAPGFEAEEVPNNGLCVNTPGFVVRILKSAEDGSVPRPGISEARRNYYRHNQGILNFENGNGNTRPQPTYHLVVHWTVDRDYNLEKISIALPYDIHRNDSGRWDVLCLFDEPYWTRAQDAKIARITEEAAEPLVDNDIAIEDASQEKTGEDSEDK
jgi:hypothetical protein